MATESATNPLDPERIAEQVREERAEHGIANVLRTGVLVAAIVTLTGGFFYLARNAFTIADYHTFRGAPDSLNTIYGILVGVANLDSRAVIQLGLLLLIATPVARVALSLLEFIRQRDRTYVIITTVVLVILSLGLSGKVSTH